MGAGLPNGETPQPCSPNEGSLASSSSQPSFETPAAPAASSSSSQQPTSFYPATTPHLNPHDLVIRANPKSGRGVYASRSIKAGTLLEISPVLIFPREEWQQHGCRTALDSYTFHWNGMGDMALALGLGSLFNHSSSPSVSYTLDRGSHSIRYTLQREVAAGDELCISYGQWGRQYEEDATGGRLSDDESDDLERMLQIGRSGSEDEGPHTSAAGSRSASSQSRALNTSSNGVSNGTHGHFTPANSPVWRLTSLPDPATVPLELLTCYALIIPARTSAHIMTFLRRYSRELGRGRNIGSEDDPIRHAKTLTRKVEDNGRLRALICQADTIDLARLREILSQEAELMEESELVEVQVASMSAPTKQRSAEWSAAWPVALRSASNQPTLNSSGSSTPVAAASAAFIDRQADCNLWSQARTRWVIRKLARCVLTARQAHQTDKELPIGVHVCPSILHTHSPTFQDGVSPSTSHSAYTGWDADGIPLEGGDAIEVDAHDTRISRRNPIKHAVGNAVHKVAEIRVQKRIPAAGTNGNTSPSPPPPPPDRPERDRYRHSAVSGDLAQSRPSSPSVPLLNGQDYLLTSLTLFTTHEPCIYCCMSLVHSRVRNVVFLEGSPGSGGCCGSQLPPAMRCDVGARDRDCSDTGSPLGGPYALQEQRGLNHRFEVWKWRGGLREIEEEVHRVDPAIDVKALLDLRQWGRIDP